MVVVVILIGFVNSGGESSTTTEKHGQSKCNIHYIDRAREQESSLWG